jgi:hypothetical protein
MSIFSKLFGNKPQLPSVEHSVFGLMHATVVINPELYFWESDSYIDSPIGAISVFADSPAEGPTDQQVSQFRQVSNNFDNLRAALRPLLLDRLSDFNLEAQIDVMKCISVTLAADGKMSSHWELTFEDPSKFGLFNVNFENGEPIFVTCDT